MKLVEHKQEEVVFDGMRRESQLGQFFLLSVPISQQLRRLTCLYFFSFLN